MALYNNNFLSQLLSNRGFLHFLNSFYVITYFYLYLFIYLFCDQFPRGILGTYVLWGQGKANKNIILYESTQDTKCNIGYTFGDSYVLSTTF